MDPRQACLACLAQDPPALFEAALWIATEHEPHLPPEHALRLFDSLAHQVAVALPQGTGDAERAQFLLRRLSELGFAEDDEHPLHPRAALLPPGLATPPRPTAVIGADRPGDGAPQRHHPGRREFPWPLPPAGARCRPPARPDHRPPSLYPRLPRPAGAPDGNQRRAVRRAPADGQRHRHAPAPVTQSASTAPRRRGTAGGIERCPARAGTGPPSASDHLARADLYHVLDCPQAERYDLERAMLLSDDAAEQMRLAQRLADISVPPKALH